MKTCSNCGTENKDSAIYCRKCGKEIGIKTGQNKKSSYKYLITCIIIAIITVSVAAYAVTTVFNNPLVNEITDNLPITTNNTTSIEIADGVNNTSNIVENNTNTSKLTNNQTNTTQNITYQEHDKIGGIIFIIPDGYVEDNFNRTTIEGDDVSTTINAAGKIYKNIDDDTISIVVTEIANGESLTEEHLKQYADESGYKTEPMTINGFDGYYYVDDYEEPVWYDFVYLRNGKIVCIAVSDKLILEEVVQ